MCDIGVAMKKVYVATRQAREFIATHTRPGFKTST
jgi:hypothetical protein